MNQSQINQLLAVYSSSLTNEILNQIVQSLIVIESLYPHRIRINFKNHPNNYFSVVDINKESPVLFAGAIEKNKDGQHFPAIRFRKQNSKLHLVPSSLKFEFTIPRKEKWICVILKKQTIQFFSELMAWELRNRFGTI